MKEQELYITITGFNHYYGKKLFKIGKHLLCVKEPDNEYDEDAIKVTMREIGTIGYVANSPYTKADGTLSAGRIYDRVGNAFVAEIMFMTDSKVICKVLPQEDTGRRYRVKRFRRGVEFDGIDAFSGPDEDVPF